MCGKEAGYSLHCPVRRVILRERSDRRIPSTEVFAPSSGGGVGGWETTNMPTSVTFGDSSSLGGAESTALL